MRRLNLSTALTIAGDATSGSIAYSGLTSPTVTEIGDNPDVTVASDGGFTLASRLITSSESVTVKVQDAAGYFIQGPVNITGDGSGVEFVPIGMNLAGLTSNSGVYPFANVCANMSRWTRRTTSGGSGAWSQHHGSLTATVSTDQFVSQLLDPNVSQIGWVDGTYRVFNPDGCWIAYGATSDAPSTYVNTSPYFDINLSPSANGVYIYAKGSVSNIKIMMPGTYDTSGPTATFNPQFLTYQQGLNASPIRFMDWVYASQNYEENWADRTLTTDVSFSTPYARNAPVVPWEYCIELANTLNKDAWLCVPARSTQAYVESLAALVAANLNPGLNVWIEVANEIWNGRSPWADGGQWISNLPHTRRIATCNGAANTFTLASHGLSEGQLIRTFTTAENMDTGQRYDSSYYGNGIGTPVYADVIDSDTFQIRFSAGGTLVPTYTDQVNLMFVDPAEYEVNQNKYYAQRCLRDWDAFDAAMDPARVKHLVASQSAAPYITSSIYGYLNSLETNGASRADHIATAPYFSGYVFGARMILTSGQILPQAWCAFSNVNFYIGVYASGSTPTKAEVVAGTGTGFIGQRLRTDYDNVGYWNDSSMTAVTGLSDGTAYEVYCVLEEPAAYSGATWMFHETVTAAASGTVYIWDSYANQALRMVLDASKSQPTPHVAAFGGATSLISYELGADYNFTGPAEAKTWRDAFMESTECAVAIEDCMYIRAAAGSIDMLCYFSDCGSGPFSLSDTYDDTADERYIRFDALNGQVERLDALDLSNMTGTTIDADPGSFPVTIATFNEPDATYAIHKDDLSGNFAVSGNTLTMVADTGIDWAARVTYTLIMRAYRGPVYKTFNVTFGIGATPATATYIGANSILNNSTGSTTWASESLGTASADRHIIVGISKRGGGNTGLASVSIAGISATKLSGYTPDTGATNVEFWGAAVPTGATGDIVITATSGNIGRAAIAKWRTNNLLSLAAVDTIDDSTLTSTQLDGVIDSTAGGIIFAMTYMSDTAESSHTYSGVDSVLFTHGVDNGASVSAAHREYVAAQTNRGVSVNYFGGGVPTTKAFHCVSVR